MCVYFFFCQSSKYLGILLIAVLVCSGCYNKIPKAEGLINRHLNLRVLEAGSSRLWCQHGWVLVKVLFQTADCLCPSVPSYGRRGLGPLWGSLTRALTPTERGPPS